MKSQLRSGYTTGSCASAAAMASAIFLLQDWDKVRKVSSTQMRELPERIQLLLANGQEAEFYPEYGTPPGEEEKQGHWCRVRKDAGDDPDVTDGVWVYAGVFPISQEIFERLCHEGAGYALPEHPGLYLNGGPGVGIAGKKGLSCPVGHYAINPVPRSVILEAVEKVRKEKGYKEPLEIRIAVPEGIFLAEKTFNPRLGILGGISILGTTGIVEPMSEEALLETIRLDIHMKASAGEEVLLLTPGNYGEDFLEKEMGVPLGEAVKCSNFIGDAVRFAAEEGFGKLLLVGHIGKLVKVTGGIKNTHSRYGDHRMELMKRLVKEVQEHGQAGKTKEDFRDRDENKMPAFGEKEEILAERIGRANTTEEAVGWLKEVCAAQAVLDYAAAKVKAQVGKWSGGQLEAETVVFSSLHGVTGKTSQAEAFLCLWKGRI